MVALDRDFYKNAIERVRSMPEDEYVEALKRAGVMDAKGRLAERYRPPSDESDY